MGVLSGILVFVLVWSLVIFMVPLGNRPHQDPGPGTAGSAPENPRLPMKMALATGITFAIWLMIFVAVEMEVFSFRDMIDPP